MTEATYAGEFMSAPTATVADNPLKTEGHPIPAEAAQLQAKMAIACLVDIDYDSVRGTCGDERSRVRLLNGEAVVEDRPSVFGGPDIYALYIGELTGYFGDSTATGEERLVKMKQVINDKKIKSGGHKKCAANASFDDVMALISHNQEGIRDYAKAQLGDEYDEDAMSEVFANATKTHSSRRYADWDEDILEKVLGDEAGEAIELLENVPHEGRTVLRVNRPGETINQTTLHKDTNGEDSFEHDEPYAERIEDAIVASSGMPKMQQIARHAREAVLAAIVAAVPNHELTQIDIY